MIVYQAALSRDMRIMLDGRIGGYRVEEVIKIESVNEVIPMVAVESKSYRIAGPLMVLPISTTDAARLRRGTICNPRKLLAHYFEERRNG